MKRSSLFSLLWRLLCSSLSWLLIKVWLAPSRLCPLFPCQQKGMLEENLDLWQWFCSFSVTHIYTPDDVNIDFQWWLSFPSFLAVNKSWSILLQNNQIKILLLKRWIFQNYFCFVIIIFHKGFFHIFEKRTICPFRNNLNPNHLNENKRTLRSRIKYNQ